jgi:hypothetical protein
MSAEADLLTRFPWIPWGAPIRVVSTETNEERWGCRFCIGLYGLRGSDHDKLWASPAEARDHIDQFHREAL